MRSLRMSHRITLLCFGALALFAGIREATAGASPGHLKRDSKLKWATSELAVELEADRRHPPLQPREALTQRRGERTQSINQLLDRSFSEKAQVVDSYKGNPSAGRPEERMKPEERAANVEPVVRIEMGDELGGGWSERGSANREWREERRAQSGVDIQSIESRLDRETREVRSETRDRRNRRQKSDREF
jgi:hypothetical protein